MGQGNVPFYASILKKKNKGSTSPAGKEAGRTDKTAGTGKPAYARDRQERSASGPDGRKNIPSAPVPVSSSGAVYVPVSKNLSGVLSRFGDILREVFPLDRKKLSSLPKTVNALSHLLTDTRNERRVGYMNNPANISAYVHYFMWWNLVRFSRLFPGLFSGSSFPGSFYAVDLGSGPLTAVCALWISCPELRRKKITWYCVDISRDALAAGEEIFLRLVALTGGEPWEIIRVRGTAGVPVREKAGLIICANVFNEMFSSDLEAGKVGGAASKAFSLVSEYAAPDSKIVLIEPGNPEGGSFVSGFRKKALQAGFLPVSPCPHPGKCPFPGGRGKKWCHFAFPVDYVPEKLRLFSEQAGLSKDRAVLSFVYLRRPQDGKAEASCASGAGSTGGAFPVRIISDPIKLPGGRTGRYGCSGKGMVLLSGKDIPVQEKDMGRDRVASPADFLKRLPFGSLVDLELSGMPSLNEDSPVDSKSGAVVINLVPRGKQVDPRRTVSPAVSAPHSNPSGRGR